MIARATFAPSRPDGRSDRQVVLDLVADAEPETVFSYAAICTALQSGVDEPVPKKRAYMAVAQANPSLLHERQRFLRVVRGRGYRVIRGDEHLPVALHRKERAEWQMRRGIDILRNVRAGEMTEPQRQLHQGQLLIMSGIYSALKDSQRRHDRQEAVIDSLQKRVSDLEVKSH